ncbi:hypothetical protein NDN08_001652 [Rhodosorus marinus]|uniref:DUF1640 domain-containing protein n=1 Tax=Rhodosorus marinus TaxID=101924 RepID=A0AAV8UVM7_9RHOD|nr:hypothetical protein NDN08_001652 [Rhodosorus marinus]
MRGLIWRGWVYRKALMEVKPAGVKELHTDVQAQQVIFDTLKMVRALESCGFTKSQAEILSDALVGISTDSTRANRDFLATKNDFNDLKSELQILEKADFAVLKSDLQILERKMETKIAAIYTEMERIENRVIKWVIGAAGTVFAVVLGFLRLSSMPQSTLSNK